MPNRKRLILGGTSFSLVLACAIAVGSAQERADLFGPLPDGALLHYEQRDVRAEIAYFFFVDPKFVAGLIPSGMSVSRLKEVARTSPNSAKYLASHPERSQWVFTVLSFPSIDTFLIEGRPASSKKPVSFAFWWAVVEDEPAVDSRARGEKSVELTLWYPERGIVRRLNNAGVDAARLGRVNVSGSGSTWSVRLRDQGIEIDGTCELTGSRSKPDLDPGQYSTIWGRGPSPGVFTLFTYAGHVTQRCTPKLTARGDAPLVKAIHESFLDEGGVPIRANVQDGWFSRVGVYRH